MAVFSEGLEIQSKQSFRLLTWDDHLRDVVVYDSGKKKRRFQGAGTEWHFHPEMELVLILQGSGTRFVSDHISAFEAPDPALIGSNLPHFRAGLQHSCGYAIQFSSETEHPLWQREEMAGLQEPGHRANRGIRFDGSTRESVANSIQQMTQLSDSSRKGVVCEGARRPGRSGKEGLRDLVAKGVLRRGGLDTD